MFHDGSTRSWELVKLYLNISGLLLADLRFNVSFGEKSKKPRRSQTNLSGAKGHGYTLPGRSMGRDRDTIAIVFGATGSCFISRFHASTPIEETQHWQQSDQSGK